MYFELDDFEFKEFDENLEDASGRTYEKAQFMAALVAEDFDGIIGLANCSNFLLTGPAGSGTDGKILPNRQWLEGLP